MQLFYSRLHDVPAIDGHQKKREPLVKNIVKKHKKHKKRKTEDNKIGLAELHPF